MTFNSAFLEQLRAVRSATPPSAAPPLNTVAACDSVPPVAEVVAKPPNLAPSLPTSKGVQTVDAPQQHSDPFTLGMTAGHCASCQRWAFDGWGYSGSCSAGRAAHGWLDGAKLAPVITSAHLACQAYGGKGWQARRSGAAILPKAQQ